MVEDSHKWLKGLLWFVAIYHIILGLLGIFVKNSAVALAKIFFNFNLTLTPQMYWVINPFAAYLLIFGVFMLVAARDPVKYKEIVYVGIILFSIRIVQRIIFLVTAPQDLISSIDPVRNILFLALVSTIGLVMFFLVRKIK